jgi:hypothetical protein
MKLNDVLASASDYIGRMARESGIKDAGFRNDVREARMRLSNAIGAQDYPKKALNIEYAKSSMNQILNDYDLDENDRRKVIQILNELEMAHGEVISHLRQQRAAKRDPYIAKKDSKNYNEGQFVGPYRRRKKAQVARVKKVKPDDMVKRAVKFIGA